MFALTYVAVNAFSDILFSLNKLYMAVIMVVPMVVLMLLFMSHMFENKKLNKLIYLASAALFLLIFVAIRDQTFSDNERFLSSMIPHHSSAIVMCERSELTDPEIITLCEEIVETQKKEIDQMNAIRTRLNR
ncbi:MAG: DUF305 domain-containing protein [Candidatus Saccharimonadales bacterium]